MFPGSQNNHVQGRAVVSPQGRVIVVGAGFTGVGAARLLMTNTNFLKSCYRYSCQNKFPSRQ